MWKRKENILKLLRQLSKGLLIGILVLAGVTSGILIGYSLIGKKQAVASNIIGDDRVDEKWKLLFGAGDTFPLVGYTTLDGNAGNSSELFQGKKTGVIFADISCEPCQEFMEQWNQIVEPKLKKDARQIVFLGNSNFVNDIKMPNYLRDKIIYLIDMDNFRKEYNLTILPTIVAVDEIGIVRHIQYGQRQGIDYEILKFLTTHDI